MSTSVSCSLLRECCVLLFCFKQRTAYDMRISDWSSDVCSSDLADGDRLLPRHSCRAADLAVVALHAGLAQGGGGAHRRSAPTAAAAGADQIGRASCRARVCPYVLISEVPVSLKQNKQQRGQAMERQVHQE